MYVHTHARTWSLLMIIRTDYWMTFFGIKHLDNNTAESTLSFGSSWMFKWEPYAPFEFIKCFIFSVHFKKVIVIFSRLFIFTECLSHNYNSKLTQKQLWWLIYCLVQHAVKCTDMKYDWLKSMKPCIIAVNFTVI